MKLDELDKLQLKSYSCPTKSRKSAKSTKTRKSDVTSNSGCENFDENETCENCSNSSSSSSSSSSSGYKSSTSSDVRRHPQPPSHLTVRLCEDDENDVKFSYVKDCLLGNMLQVRWAIVPECYPDSVMVRASRSGSRMRVLACRSKPITTSDGQQVRMEFSKTFTLPVCVDPNRLKAKVDKEGNLRVSAPINPSEKRSSRLNL